MAPPPPALPVPAPPATDLTAVATERLPKITLLLVLGHYFERLVRDGAVKDYAEIAGLTGLSRARVTQIANLTLLASPIQEAILASPGRVQIEHQVCERALRGILGQPAWSNQMRLWLGSISPTSYNQSRR